MASMTSSNKEECKLKKFENFDYPSSCSSPGGLNKREKSYKGKKKQKKFILEGIKEEQDSSDNSESGEERREKNESETREIKMNLLNEVDSQFREQNLFPFDNESNIDQSTILPNQNINNLCMKLSQTQFIDPSVHKVNQIHCLNIFARF